MSKKIRKEMTETYYDGGVSFHQISELGANRPDIADFLRFSEEYKDVPFRAISSFGGLEFVFDYQEEFEKIDVDGARLAGCMDADSNAIRTVCRRILGSIVEGQALSRDGETHLVSRGRAISPAAVKAFILAVFDARERYQIDEVVPEFYFLLSQVLFPGDPEAETLRASKDLRFNSVYISWAYHHKYRSFPSYRRVAKLLGVAPSTISRLFESREEFEAAVESKYVFAEDPSTIMTLRNIYASL